MSIRTDKVELKFDVRPNYEAQQLQKLKDDLTEAKNHLKDLQDEKKSLVKPKKSDTQAWAEYRKKLEDVNRRIAEQDAVVKKAEQAIEQQRNKMGLAAMTLRDLQNELKKYNTILQNLTPGTEQFNEAKRHVEDLKNRIKELRSTAESTKKSLNLFSAGNGFLENFNQVGFAIKSIWGMGQKVIGVFRGVYDYLAPMADMATELEGIEMAFRRIDQPGLLDNLRAATHGTVSDLELMKQAVKFKDFNLPVEQLGTYLAFAQQKAKDTGESIDYLVNSIVTGLGRQSPQILDNLGLSAKQISEEAKRSGDFFGAVAKIVEENMSKAGEYVETASDRAAQATVRLQNAQTELGRAWQPVKEQIDSTYGSLQVNIVNAVRWIIQHRDVIKTLVATLGTLVAAEALHYAWTKRQIVADRVHAALTVVRNKALQLHTILSASDTTATQKLTAATKALNLSLLASPWTWVAAVMATVVAVTMTLRNRTSQLAETTRMMNGIQRDAATKAQLQREKVEALISVAEDETAAMTDRLEATRKLNKIIPDYNAQIDQTTGKYTAAKEKLDEYLTSLTRQYEIEGAKEMFQKLGRQLAVQNTKLEEAKENLEQAQELNKAAAGLNMSSNVGTLSYTRSTWGEERVVESAEKALKQTQSKINALKNAYGIDIFSDITSGNEDGNQDDNGNSSKTDPYRTDLDTLERNHRQALNILKQAYADGKKTEQEYTQDTYTLQQARLQALLALQQKYGKDTTETEGKIIDATIEQAKRKQAEADKAQQQKEKEQQDTLKALEEAYKQQQLDLTRQRADGILKTEADYDRQKEDKEIEYLEKRITLLRQYGRSALAEEQQIANLRLQQLSKSQKQQLDTLKKQAEEASSAHDYQAALTLQQRMLDAGLISQQQYEDAKTQITQKGEQERQQIRDAYFQQAQQAQQALSSLFSAMQQREEDRVSKKYQNLIKQAQKNGRDTTKLEEQQEAELTDIRKRYADKQFALSVLQIIAQTAQGISKIWAEWGWNPPVATTLTATSAAVGAIQLATAKAQRDQAAGLYTGGYSDEYQEGYTGNGDPHEVAGVIPVHRREFVINHEALQMPVVKRVADIIDGAQRRRSYNLQNTTRQLQQALLPANAGLANGGYTSQGSQPSSIQTSPSTSASPGDLSPSPSRLVPLLEENNRLLEQFLASGLTILQLRREIRKQERLEQNASR